MELDTETGIQVKPAVGLAKIPRKARQCTTGSLKIKSTMQVNAANQLSSPSPAEGTKIHRKRSPIRAPGWEASHTYGGIGSGRPMFSDLKPKNNVAPKTNRGKFERCDDHSESESDEDETKNVKNELSSDSGEEKEDDEEAPEEDTVATSSGSIKRCHDSLTDVDGESSGKNQKDADGCEIDLEDDEAAPAVPKKFRTAPKKPTTITSSGINPAAIEGSASVESEFDKNTREIMANSSTLKSQPEEEDYVMKNVLGNCFNNACVGYLSNNCTTEPCDHPHQLPEMAEVRHTFAATIPRGIDEIYGVASKHPLLFETYFGLFVETFIRCYPKGFEPMLARMIKDCARTQRSQSLFRILSDVLVKCAKMPRYKAIQLVIKHHVTSSNAHGALLEMIIETGPDLIRFLDYLMKSCKVYPLSAADLDRVLANCVTYHDPRLPMFCLESLRQRSSERIQGLNQANITKFIELQTYLTGGNDGREAKLENFIAKVLQ